MPITWRNIGAPETYSGNQLMNQGINHMNTGMGQLAAFGQQQQQNNINQQQAFEQEQAQAFEQQLMGMDDTQVMALQEQFQANPEAAQQQFGSQAENIFNALQQEPARREEQANAEFQRQQQTMARTTAPIIARGQSELAAFNMDPSDPSNREALNTTIQELQDMGAHAQVAEMRQLKLASMNEQELRQRDQNLRGMRNDVNRLQQQVIQGNMSQGDFLKQYDKLTEQYGEDVVSEVMPYNQYNQIGLESAQQAGQISEVQRAQIEAFNADVEYYQTRLNEEFEADLAEIERLSPDNYYASLNEESRQAEDTGAITQNWITRLQGEGISEKNAGKYSRFAQAEAQKIFDETLKEQTGLSQLPGVLVERALNNVSLDSRWFDSLGPQDENKARITDALRQEANNYLNAERMTQRKNEAEREHRRRLQALREETRTVNSRLSQHVSGDMNAQITPDFMERAIGETQVISRLLNQRRTEEEQLLEPEQVPNQNQVQEPELNEFQLMLQAQEAGQSTPEMDAEIARVTGQDTQQPQTIGTSEGNRLRDVDWLNPTARSVIDAFGESNAAATDRNEYMAWLRANNIQVTRATLNDPELLEQFMSQ